MNTEHTNQPVQAEPATHSPIALQSIPKRQRDFTAENIRDIAHECMRIGDNEQAAVVFAIADALRDGNLTIHPAAVAVRIRELEAQLNAAIHARQEAQQIAQEAIEARNRAGVEIRRPLLKRIRELQAQQAEPVNQQLLALVKSFGHKTGCAKNAFGELCTCGADEAIAAAEQEQQAEPVALIMCDGKSYDFMVTVEGQKRIPDTGEFVHLYATQPPAVAVPGATDDELEEIAKRHGVRWDGDFWSIEDADLHPFMRAMLAAAPQAATEGCGACGDGCQGQGCRLERESPPTCQTCNGKGMIGGLLPNGGGYDGEPCPDCTAPKPTAEESSVVGGAGAAPAEWPTAQDVGRIGDMSKVASLRVGLDADSDVYVCIHGEAGSGSVEFCVPGSGGGKSPRTRAALISLMLAMEADNAETPSRDWWKAREGDEQKGGA